MAFAYHHQVQFYETDLMGIVHHSNYLRFFEEARVAWAHHAGMIDYQKPETASSLAVLETQVRHLRPCFFGDQLQVDVQVRNEGIRIFFQYRLQNKTQNTVSAVGVSVHACLNKQLKPTRLQPEFLKILEKEKWTEIWL